MTRDYFHADHVCDVFHEMDFLDLDAAQVNLREGSGVKWTRGQLCVFCVAFHSYRHTRDIKLDPTPSYHLAWE